MTATPLLLLLQTVLLLLQHGLLGVRGHSEGYPEAWYLPDDDDIPSMYHPVRRGRAHGQGFVSRLLNPGHHCWHTGSSR